MWEDDEDLSDYEIIEDEDEEVLEGCSCSRGCFNCLEMSWKDFM